MPGYKKTSKLTKFDAAYAAGLIDGEGTVTPSRKHRGENRQLVVSISSTERPILDFVLSKAGTGKITSKRASKPNHTPSFTYSLWNRQALDLLAQVVRFMHSCKRQRAVGILSDYVRLTPRNGNYPNDLRQERADFEATILKLNSRNSGATGMTDNHN